MEKRRASGPILILVGLLTRRYGLTIQEMMKEAKLSRISTFRYLKTLESLGVVIHRQKEPVRSSWRTNYRIVSIRGNTFNLNRKQA